MDSLNDYLLLGRSGLRVSRLCLGAMTFGTEWGWGAEEKECRRQVDIFADRGGNFIDTADGYTGGTSEKMIGDFIAGNRNRWVISTKYTMNTDPADPNAGGNARKNLVQSLDASLKRLRTDYIDLYYVHSWEFRTPVEEVMRALDDAVRQGKILYAGVSNAPAWKIAEANVLARCSGWTPFIAAQIQYSMLHRTPEFDLVPMSIEHGVGIVPWSPLAGGLLTGKYTGAAAESAQNDMSSRGDTLKDRGAITPQVEKVTAVLAEVAKTVGHRPEQVALNWLLRKQGVQSLVLGARTAEQLENNLGCLDFDLDGEQMRRLDEVSAIELPYPASIKPITSYYADGAQRITPGFGDLKPY